MHRRRLLQSLLGSAALAPWLAAWSPRLRAQEEDTEAPSRNVADVLVLGAGMAGIAAARELRQLGATVIVIEARDRIGGRIHTESARFGVPVDLGAAWIHGVDGNPLTRLAAAAGIETVATDWEALAAFAGTRRLPDALLAQADALDDRVQVRLQALRRDAAVGQSLGELLDRAQTEILADADPAAAQAARWLGWTDISLDYAVEPAQLSASGWGEDEEYGGDHVLLRQGYGALVEQLARGLDVRLGQWVTAVEHGADGVLLRTRGGAVYEADALVCTLPLGVLKAGDVAFDPPLPAAQRGAIERLTMGTLGKVVLRYPQAFWPKDVQIFGRVDAPLASRAEFYSLLPTHAVPVLVALTVGAQTRALERLDQDAAVARMHGELKALFGPRIPQPVAGLCTRWSSDPCSRGSYSALSPRATPADYETLAKPVGECVFMAGEATVSDYPATVHGAWLSGVRAAGQVARWLE